MRAVIVLASLCAALPAAADEPAEDPKAAIAERGIVLKAGKRNFFVVVPLAEPLPTTPKGSVFHKSRVFYGDAKSLYELDRYDFNQTSDGEFRDLGFDPRWILTQHLWRKSGGYELHCGTTFGAKSEKRTITLEPAQRTAIAKAVITKAPEVRLGYVLARQSTTYIYVDHAGGYISDDTRIFVGKRGAMKQLPIKDIANDSASLVIVTAKGTLMVTKAGKNATPVTATYGPAKKPTAASVLPIDNNRKLIYRELGVYTREKTGQPCDEL